jgi:lipoteichoic acid synthase
LSDQRLKIPCLCVIGLILLKNVILTGYIVNKTYPVSGVWNSGITSLQWIPSLSSYLCWTAIIVAPCLLLAGKAQYWFLLLLNAGISSIFIIDLWFFRAYWKFTSIYHLYELGNLHGLSSAIISFVHPSDFLLFGDVLAFSLYYWHSRGRLSLKRSVAGFLFVAFASLGYLFYFNKTQLVDGNPVFSIRWVPIETISVLSPLGYHIYDLFSVTERKKIVLTPGEGEKIKAWYEQNKEELLPNRYKGLFQNCSLILLQCESLENFVIGKSIAGQEITPTLNRIRKNSLYFTNVLEQVGDGTSIDAEFMVNTSVYPLRLGSVSLRYPQNAFNSLPLLLKKRGYRTVDIHPDPGAYWNWMELMKALGMSDCLDFTRFQMDEVIDLGLSDGSFLRQAIPILASLPQPFYAYMITLTNHCPYDLPKSFRELKLEKKFDQSEIGGYLQSVHYMDKQIGIFLSRLESTGLLKNTAVGLFGDHCGIHKFSSEALAELPEDQQAWLENGNRIPLLFYKKNLSGEQIEYIGGQIDIFPTIAYLMGVEEKEFEKTAMGRNLLNTHRSFAVLNDGTFVSSKSDENLKGHALEGPDIADKIIRSDYFLSANPGHWHP